MNLSISSNMIISFFMIQPIIDLFTSLIARTTNINLTIGLIIRSLFMAYIILYVIFSKVESNKIIKYSKIIMYALLTYMTVFLVVNFFKIDRSLIMVEVKGMVKTFYFAIILCGLIVANTKNKINISNKILTIILFGYTSIIFIATITNTYFNSYNRNGYGSVGWFYAANEIGSIIAILIPFTVVYFIQNKLSIFSILSIILCTCSTIFLGTKVPFLGIVGGICFITVYYTILKAISKKWPINIQRFNYKKIVLLCLSILLVMVFTFPISPLYKNVQRNYSGILNRLFNNSKIETNIENKKEDTTEEVTKDELVTAILSKRTIYAEGLKEKFKHANFIDKSIGMGYNVQIKGIDGKYTNKTVELDQLDILYRHGILGSIIYFSQMVVFLIYILVNILRNKKYLLDINIIVSIFSIILSFGIAFTAGHVLTAPGVGIFLIMGIIRLYNLTTEGNIQ